MEPSERLDGRSGNAQGAASGGGTFCRFAIFTCCRRAKVRLSSDIRPSHALSGLRLRHRSETRRISACPDSSDYLVSWQTQQSDFVRRRRRMFFGRVLVKTRFETEELFSLP